ncbi:UDP-N-acetylmuramoyl-tripeptide--D-alanyl-D-alanine ligase [Humitalea sp. 24SJ18S-53]|uniref:UDP-N-acetylmuramoyl-tripeptide--D-alanyl-D- alanine ligase n=1 Tax=Humitalea sp. 24SJ18S-53 TaxID=3422307 RepID=UPI003D679D97
MSALWTAADLCAATGGTGGADVTGIAIDSRATVAGDLFVALLAERDGHDFVADAFGRGAACAMVTRDMPGGPCLRVADTLDGLTALGAAGRARSRARVVAVTGSVAKTTVKEMLRHGLSAQAPVHASAASHNNQWGVPLTLARQQPGAAYAVIEIGMNNRGEIAPLARLAQPHVAVITNIGTAHIGHLGSEAAIADEKGDILLGLTQGGTAVLPADSPFFASLAARAKSQGAAVVGFGEAPEASARLLGFTGSAEGGVAEVSLHGTHLTIALGAPGRHMAVNALAALAAAAALGADPARFAASLADFDAVAGRGQRIALRLAGGGQALLLDESYNASTASIRAALAVLAAQPARRRIAVLGDMRELGEHGPALHAGLAADAAAADLVFACGPLMAGMFAGLPAEKRGAHADDSATLAPIVAAAVRDGDALMVKGSLGSRMAVVVTALKGLSQ